MSELVLKDESYRIMGACFEVYKDKGCGFLEPVYQECLEIELQLQEIPFQAQQQLPLDYKGRRLKQIYIPVLSALAKSLWRSRPFHRCATSTERKFTTT